jgi:hypothetical protein
MRMPADHCETLVGNSFDVDKSRLGKLHTQTCDHTRTIKPNEALQCGAVVFLRAAVLTRLVRLTTV